MTTTQPDDEPTDYPDNWKPPERVQLDKALEPLEVEVYLSSLPPRELTHMLQRIRAMS
jgi:hypothetical protein